jgi:hypothetical protein
MLHSAVNGGAIEATGMSNPFGIGAKPLIGNCFNPAMSGPRIQIRSEAIVRMQTPFFKANVGGAGGPGTPPKPGTPPEPVEPEVPPDPDVPIDPMDPVEPTDPTDPGVPPCN